MITKTKKLKKETKGSTGPEGVSKALRTFQWIHLCIAKRVKIIQVTKAMKRKKKFFSLTFFVTEKGKTLY